MSGDDDIDKVFEELVSQIEFDDADAEPSAEQDAEPPPTPPDSLASRFAVRGWSESNETEATWADEGHFIPPEPPPGPPIEPRRRLAWIGLFGSPAVMVAAVVGGFGLPPWVLVLLVLAFVGGFVYLVSTMAGGPHDPWSGDDGAVV